MVKENDSEESENSGCCVLSGDGDGTDVSFGVGEGWWIFCVESGKGRRMCCLEWLFCWRCDKPPYVAGSGDMDVCLI